MRICDFYQRPTPTLSFEFFPPKNADMEAALLRDVVPGLIPLHPAFISVTYGAGGGTRESTQRIVNRIRAEHNLEAMPHLTCVGSTREQIGTLIDEYQDQGIENILALRGDPPKGQADFSPMGGGFATSTELIRFIKTRGPFCVGAACFPEGHVDARFKRVDWDYTAGKVEAGADFLISQLFYDWSDFLDMWDYLRNRRDVRVPIVPGILPFLSGDQIRRFAGLCGARLPKPLLARIDKYGSDEESVRKLGVEVCTELCRKLLDAGVPGFHFYCLNRVQSVAELVKNLS